MPPELRAVLFDMDGVLVHSYDAWFALLNRVAADLARPAISPQAFAAGWGQGVQADAACWFGGIAVSELEARYTRGFVEHLGQVQVEPGAHALFAALADAGMALAVITNTPHDMARAILAEVGLEVEVLVGGTDVPRAKPAPDMVQAAALALGVPLSACVVVGDSRFDELAAAAAGSHFIGFRRDPNRVDGLDDVLPRVLGSGSAE